MNAAFDHIQSRSIFDAVEELAAARVAEDAANARRLRAEAAVLVCLGKLPEEGTHKEQLGPWQLVITTSIRRTVDAEALAAIAPRIPEAIGRRLIRWKPDLQMRELRYVQSNEPEIYALLAQVITAKPAKPSIKLERQEI
jgi:hypothetical protein